MGLKIHTLKDKESQQMASEQLEVRERIYLTSDKRAVVPESDRKARFLLSSVRPVSAAKAKEIRGYRHGAAYLFKVGSEKAGKPQGDTAGEPDADKGEAPGDPRVKASAFARRRETERSTPIRPSSG